MNQSSFKSPISIRIIYWFTQFGFWLFSVAGGFLFILGLSFLFGFDFVSLQINISLPLRFDLQEVGYFTHTAAQSPVNIVEASGKMQITEIPLSIMRYFSLGWIGLILIAFMVLWYIRKFVMNVERGVYFELQNIQYLKLTSYGIMILWFYNLVANLLMNQFLLPNLEFDTILFYRDFSFNFELLFFAVFIWALAIIFSAGAKIKEEQDLTV